MQPTLILVIFIAILVNLRTFTLLFGMISEIKSEKNNMLMVVASVLLDVCGFRATRNVFFVILGGVLCAFFAFEVAKKHRTKEKKFDEIQFIDALVMQMRAGMSFENALSEISKTFHAKSVSTYGQNTKLGQILARCEQNASQSFKILSSYRLFLRVRERLHRKHSSVTLQTRAQAVVCAALFFMILTAEWLMFPNFAQFVATSWGRLTLTFTFFLLLMGEKAIISLSKPREIDL